MNDLFETLANAFRPTTVNANAMKTNKAYSTEFMNYGVITVPAGTIVTHETAQGHDENYHFVNSFGWVKTNYPEIANILLHDLTYHGIDVPKEYIEI